VIFFYGLVGAIVLTDQFLKFLALKLLSPETSVPVIPKVLSLTLVHNRGVAFGLFSDAAPVLFTVITISLVALFFLANRPEQHVSERDRWALGLILGGAIGNWIDRLRFAAVIDFIDFHIWPVFNLADSAITIGVCLYLLSLFLPQKSSAKKS